MTRTPRPRKSLNPATNGVLPHVPRGREQALVAAVRQEQALLAVVQQRNTYIAAAAHDMKNQITVIQTVAQLLER